MRRLFLMLCWLPIWASCSCDGKKPTDDVRGIVHAAASLDFGGVFVDGRDEKLLSLRNDGRAVVQAWAETVPAGFDLLPTRENPVVIGPSQTVEVKVTFSPDKVGAFEGELVLGTLGTKEPVRPIRLTGVGLHPDLDVPRELAFGVVPVASSHTLPLPIGSFGDGDRTVKIDLVEGEGVFRIDVDEVFVPNGGEAVIDVTFAPLVKGHVRGGLAVRGCDECPQSLVRLHGEGGHTDLRADPPMLTFGTISPGMRQELALRLVNTGNLPIEVARAAFVDPTDPAFVGGESLATFPTVIEVDQVHNVHVAFAPAIDLAELGEKEGSLAFFGADDGLLFEVPLRGIAGGPDLKVDPGHIDFGVVPLRLQSRKTVTLSNIGNRAPATVEEIFIRGNASRFEVRSPHPDGRFPLEDEPVVIEVFFTAPADKELVGHYADTLVIRTDDDDSSEIQVALTAHAADIPPCDLRITPGQVRFGLVPAGIPFERDVEVFNQGIAECAVWDFHLESDGAGAFSLVEPPEGTRILASRETLKLKLRFAPPAGVVNQLLASAIVFSHSTLEDEPKRVEVSGYPSTHQLEIIPNPVDFGPVPIGYGPIRAVSIINTGATGTEVADVRIDPPTGTNFRVAPGSASSGTATVPGVVASGERAPVRASFTATSEGVETAELQVWIAGVEEPMRVPMRAEGRDEPCGDLCEAPQAICPPNERVLVNHAHPLPGEAFNAAGDDINCSWRVLFKPFGSREQPHPADTCATSFTPDMVGDYVLEMAVLDEQGKYNSCQTTVTAIPHGGLWVETYWEKASDVDLHLLHPEADPSVSSNWWSEWDCYYSPLSRAWDGGGEATAWLDRDDTLATGPENIRINRPVIGHRYAVGLHWYRTAGHTSTWVTTNIYCGGVLAGSETLTLNTSKEFVLVGDIQNNGLAGCTWRPDGSSWIRD